MCIQPVYIQYKWDLFNPCVVRSGNQTVLSTVRVLCNTVNYQHIKYLKSYYPSEEEKKDPILFRDNVRDV